MFAADANDSQRLDAVLQEAHALLKGLMEKKMSAVDVNVTGVLDAIEQRANTQRDLTRGTSRTAALWIQYMEMVNILRTFIKAERTAN